MELPDSLIAATVRYGHFHSMPTAFLHMFGVELANQIATNGIGLAKQCILPVYRSAIAIDPRPFVLSSKDYATRTSPLLRIKRNDLRRYGIDCYRISGQVPDADFHKTILRYIFRLWR